MAFREIKPAQPLQTNTDLDLFEDSPALEQAIRKPSPQTVVVRPANWKTTYSPDSVPIENFPLVRKPFRFPKLTLPKLRGDPTLLKKAAIWVVKDVVGVGMVWFGVTSTGSYFGPKSGVFGKELAVLFYQYEFGIILAVIGLIIIYDTLRHR